LDQDPRAESLIRQASRRSSSDRTAVRARRRARDSAPRAATTRHKKGRSPHSFASIDKLHPAVNVASMVGLGGLRGIVVGNDDRPATAAELARMTAMVEEALHRARAARRRASNTRQVRSRRSTS
jgi:N-acyl-D-amino-acid deacylase